MARRKKSRLEKEVCRELKYIISFVKYKGDVSIASIKENLAEKHFVEAWKKYDLYNTKIENVYNFFKKYGERDLVEYFENKMGSKISNVTLRGPEPHNTFAYTNKRMMKINQKVCEFSNHKIISNKEAFNLMKQGGVPIEYAKKLTTSECYIKILLYEGAVSEGRVLGIIEKFDEIEPILKEVMKRRGEKI